MVYWSHFTTLLCFMGFTLYHFYFIIVLWQNKGQMNMERWKYIWGHTKYFESSVVLDGGRGLVKDIDAEYSYTSKLENSSYFFSTHTFIFLLYRV